MADKILASFRRFGSIETMRMLFGRRLEVMGA